MHLPRQSSICVSAPILPHHSKKKRNMPIFQFPYLFSCVTSSPKVPPKGDRRFYNPHLASPQTELHGKSSLTLSQNVKIIAITPPFFQNAHTPTLFLSLFSSPQDLLSHSVSQSHNTNRYNVTYPSQQEKNLLRFQSSCRRWKGCDRKKKKKKAWRCNDRHKQLNRFPIGYRPQL
ncbi:hypothetical protein QC762_604590 [Podospora pseudocomata]|uniref:Uncharacterized protein n=1 Tax=Podospora pseudocomata TaxID=2093779 RepID=A0ABR0G697_9PEZI|nr:hypothetical protein QC762_604590 [Podospora pseudocomata]